MLISFFSWHLPIFHLAGHFKASCFENTLMLPMLIGFPVSFHNSAHPIFNLLCKIQVSILAFKGNLGFLNLTDRVHSQPRNTEEQQQRGTNSASSHQEKPEWPKQEACRVSSSSRGGRWLRARQVAQLCRAHALPLESSPCLAFPKSSWLRPLWLLFFPGLDLTTRVAGEPGNNQHSSAVT